MTGLNWNTTRASPFLPSARLFVSLLMFAIVCIAGERSFVGAMSPPVSSAATGIHQSTTDDVADDSAAAELALFRAMHSSILARRDSGAFLAALDQSGGSTPKALAAYGMGPEEGNYEIGTESMFDAVHSMRTRIMTSPCFIGDKILGAILFENTMDRTVNGLPTCEYLWGTKEIVPFLKIDKGLRNLDASDADVEIVEGELSVQVLNPIPDLETLLQRAKSLGVYGTKARSLILNPKHPDHIDALVKQQFEVARSVLREGLIPIIEPEVDVTQDAADKQACEEILCKALLRELEALKDEDSLSKADAKTLLEDDQHRVMIKISLPEIPNQYQECIDHPCCLQVVALSGGYDQTEASVRLSRSKGIIASFSRALAEGLSHGMTDDEFESCLSQSLSVIHEASASSSP